MKPTPSKTPFRFGSSLTLKIFAVCFVSTHVPLLALVIYLFAGFENNPMPVFGTILAATLIGTAFCLTTVWMLLRPLHAVAEAVQKYRAVGIVPQISSNRRDEVGIVTNGVTKLIADLDATLSQRPARTRWCRSSSSISITSSQSTMSLAMKLAIGC
jgi:hypothetical protein